MGHNINFDLKVLRKEFERLGWEDAMHGKEIFCTHALVGRSSATSGRRAWAARSSRRSSAELYRRLFPDEEDYVERHHAADDTFDMMKCFWELRRLGVL